MIVDKRCPQLFAAIKGRLDELRRMPWEAAEKLVVDRAWVEECAQVCLDVMYVDGRMLWIYMYKRVLICLGLPVSYHAAMPHR